jgi:hypothetical protein
LIIHQLSQNWTQTWLASASWLRSAEISYLIWQNALQSQH